jgi:hypothetical protein
MIFLSFIPVGCTGLTLTRELIVKRATGTVPENREAQLIGKQMRNWEEEYFKFLLGYIL